MRVSIKDVDVVGFPMQISSRHYIRNAFNFNVCFVVKKGKSQGYEAMVKKTVLKLEYLEREKGFLQQPNILVARAPFSLSLDYYERHSGDHLHQYSGEEQLRSVARPLHTSPSLSGGSRPERSGKGVSRPFLSGSVTLSLTISTSRFAAIPPRRSSASFPTR